MTQRVTGGVNQTLSYDYENCLIEVEDGTNTVTFAYDGNGQRVKKVGNGVITIYIGNYYEVYDPGGVNEEVTKYYYASGKRIAMRKGDALYWVHSEHLGSTAITTDGSRVKQSELRYYPYGSGRYSWGTTPTDYKFTGQMLDESTGLYFYNARYYDPILGRFIQADIIVPDPGIPQGLNRYSYVYNNPLKYIDPSGHCAPDDEACLALKAQIEGTYNISVYGLWTLKELQEFYLGLQDAIAALGGEETFTSVIGRFSVERIGFNSFLGHPAVTLINSIFFFGSAFDSEDWARRITIHEIAHLWDFRKGQSLSRGLQETTGGETERTILGFPVGRYWYGFEGGGEPVSEYAKTSRLEDWAESFTAYAYGMYPAGLPASGAPGTQPVRGGRAEYVYLMVQTPRVYPLGVQAIYIPTPVPRPTPEPGY